MDSACKRITRLQECSVDERTILELYYSTIPAGDIGDYDFSLYKKFADFGIFLAENSEWSSKIPEDILFQSSAVRENERIMGTPAGIIRSGQAGLMGRKVLFAAICRTMGIPARVNPIDLSVQYYQDGGFKNAEDVHPEDAGTAKLIILGSGDKEKWSYLHNWTIGVLNDGIYQTLELTAHQWADGRLELSLSPGCYRLITSSRMPNGNQFARKYCFSIGDGENKQLEISLRHTEIKDMLENIAFAPFKVFNDKNESLSVDSVVGDKTVLFVWLEEGHEPTEHILNEFIEAKDALNSMECEIIFIIRSNAAYSNKHLPEHAGQSMVQRCTIPISPKRQ